LKSNVHAHIDADSASVAFHACSNYEQDMGKEVMFIAEVLQLTR
jgi:hypothetical protein